MPLRSSITYPQFGGGGGSGSMNPASPYSYTAAYGGKPQIPDPTAAVSGALAGNFANMGDITKLGQTVDDFNYSEMLRNVIAQDPNYATNRSLQSGNAQSKMKGEVSAFTQNVLGQGAAERGISRGGVLTNPDFLRALGLTSEALQTQGGREYNEFLSTMLKPERYDISKSFVNPGDIYSAQMNANMVAAAPDPYAKAMAELSAALSGLSKGMQASPGTGSGGVVRSGGGYGSSGFQLHPGGGGGTITGGALGAPAYESTFDWNKWVGSLPGASNSTYDPYLETDFYNPTSYIEDAPAAGPDYGGDYGLPQNYEGFDADAYAWGLT